MNTYRATKDGSPRLLSRSKPPPPPTAANSIPFVSSAVEESATSSKNVIHVEETSQRYQLSQPPQLQPQQQLEQRYDAHLQQQQQQHAHQHLPPFRHISGVTPSRSTSSYLSTFSLPSSDSVGFDDFLSDHGQHASFREGFDGSLSFSQDETSYSSSWNSYPSFASPQEYGQLSSSVQRSSSFTSTSHRFQGTFSSSHSLSLGTSSSSATLASVASTAASSLMEPPHHTENVKKGSVHYGQEDVEHDEDSMTESDEDAKEHEQIKEESGPRPLQFQHHTSDHAIQNRLHQQPPPLQPQTHAHAHPQQPQTQLHTPQQETYSASFMSEREFLQLIDDYLLSLSPKKREKALLSNAMYQKILMVLLQPKNTQVSTAQFRFWAKKMFTLSTTPTHHIVCHGGKPVATKECLYDVLVYCHRKSAHGGRDKTSAEVRQHYSWVPKELIARFVKSCPLCSSRRLSLARVPSSVVAAGTPMIAPSSTQCGEAELNDVTKDDPMIDADEGAITQAHFSQQTQFQQSGPWGPLPSVAVAPLSSLELEAQIGRERPLAPNDTGWIQKSNDSSSVGAHGQQHPLKVAKVERDSAPTSAISDKWDEQRHSLDHPMNLNAPPGGGSWASSQGQIPTQSGNQSDPRTRSLFTEHDVGDADFDRTHNEGEDQTSDGGHEADIEGAPCDDYPDMDEGEYLRREKPQEVIERVAGVYFGYHHDTHNPGASGMRHAFLNLPRYYPELHAHQQHPGFHHHQGGSMRVHSSAHGQHSGELILHGRQLVANRHLQALGYPAPGTISDSPSHTGHAPTVFSHPLSRFANRGAHAPSTGASHSSSTTLPRLPYHTHQGRAPHLHQAQSQGEELLPSRQPLQGYDPRTSYAQRSLSSSQVAFARSMPTYADDVSASASIHPHSQTLHLNSQQQHLQMQQQHLQHLHGTQAHHSFSGHHSLQQELDPHAPTARQATVQHPSDQLWSQGRYHQYHHHRSSSDTVTQQLHVSPSLSRLFSTDGAYESYNRYRSSATFSEDMDERTSLSGNDSFMFSSSSTNLFVQEDGASRSIDSTGLSQGKVLQRQSTNTSQQLSRIEVHKGGAGGGEAGNSLGVGPSDEQQDNSMAVDDDEKGHDDQVSVARMENQPPTFSSQPSVQHPPPQVVAHPAPMTRHSFPGYYQHPSLYHMGHPLSLQSTSQLFQQVPSYMYPTDHSREGTIQRPPSQPSLSSSQHFGTDLPPLQRSASQNVVLGSYAGSSIFGAPTSSSSSARRDIDQAEAIARQDQGQNQGQHRDQSQNFDQDQIMLDESDPSPTHDKRPTSTEGQGIGGRRLSISANLGSGSSQGDTAETGEASNQEADARGRALCKSSSLAHLLH